MIQPKFIDSIGHVRISGGIVRVDLMTQSATETDDKGDPVLQLADQLVMSPNGFLRLYGSLNNAIQKMQEDGILKGNAEETAEDTATH
jgi:hypothetical protein